MVAETELRRARPTDAPAVSELFAEIVASGAARWFHPHPFDGETVARLCAAAGRDLYLVAMDRHGCAGWGMLRGWEAGYEVPSLGIYVADRARGTGVARALMERLHLAAAARGAPAVRLKVYPDNQRAVALYRRLGYVFAPGLEQGQLVGRLVLEPRAARLAADPTGG